MDTIDNNVMQEAAEYVIRAQKQADIHTVTVVLNGQHGGADVRIEGYVHGWFPPEEFTEEHVIR